MYSIYDYYGYKNDLQNRYESTKNAGNTTTSMESSTSSGLNNTPFLPATSNVTGSVQPPNYNGGVSLYNYPTEGGQYSSGGGGYTEADLASYPSPSWMAPVANAMFNAATGLADMAVPGLGFVAQQGRAYSMDPTNYNPGRNLFSGGLNYGLNYGLSKAGITGGLTNLARTGNNLVDTGVGLGIKGGLDSLVTSFVNFLTGNIFGPQGPRGHNNMAGYDDETYGYTSTAQTPEQIANSLGISLGSLLSSGLYGGASYADEYARGGLGNPDYNAYPNTGGIATGPSEAGGEGSGTGTGTGIGSGGADGNYMGDAWGEFL